MEWEEGGIGEKGRIGKVAGELVRLGRLFAVAVS